MELHELEGYLEKFIDDNEQALKIQLPQQDNSYYKLKTELIKVIEHCSNSGLFAKQVDINNLSSTINRNNKESLGQVTQTLNSNAKQSQKDLAENFNNQVTAIRQASEKTSNAIDRNNNAYNANEHKKEEENLGQFKKIFGLIKNISNIASSIANTQTVKQSIRRLEWLKELEKSGIKLTEGFDESFTKLANKANMTHDEFVKMLTTNSRSIANLNAKGIDGVTKISNATGNIVEKFGLGPTGAGTVMNHYLKTVAELSNEEELRNRNMNLEVFQTAKHFKTLSALTGKLTEQIAEEIKLKEDDLYDTRIRNTPLKNWYESLISYGFTREQARDITSGVLSDSTIPLAATSGGNKFLSMLMQITSGIRAGSINPYDDIALGRLYNNAIRTSGVGREMDALSLGQAAVLSNDSIFRTIFLTTKKQGTKLVNVDTAIKQVDNLDKESIIANRIEEIIASMKKVGNEFQESLSLSTKRAVDFGEKLKIAGEAIAPEKRTAKIMTFGAGLGYTALEIGLPIAMAIKGAFDNKKINTVLNSLHNTPGTVPTPTPKTPKNGGISLGGVLTGIPLIYYGKNMIDTADEKDVSFGYRIGINQGYTDTALNWLGEKTGWWKPRKVKWEGKEGQAIMQESPAETADIANGSYPAMELMLKDSETLEAIRRELTLIRENSEKRNNIDTSIAKSSKERTDILSMQTNSQSLNNSYGL